MGITSRWARIVGVLLILFTSVNLSDSVGAAWTTSNDGPAMSPWPMFHRDARRRSRSPYTGPEKPFLKWHYTVASGSSSSPAIGPDGTIYVGANDDRFHAINPDGTGKWTYTVDHDIWSSPAVADDGTIYIGHNGYLNGNLLALNPDGTLKWSYPAREVRSSPAIASDGIIYVGASDARLYAIHPSGAMKWVYMPGFSESYSSPAVDLDGTIYIAGTKDLKLHAVKPDGREKWTYQVGTSGDTLSTPAIGSDGTIYVGGTNTSERLYALNPNGTLKWSYKVGIINRQNQSAAIGLDGTVYVIARQGTLYALTPEGSLKWTYDIGLQDIFTTPTIDSQGTLYFGASDGKVYAINPNGTEKWTFQASTDELRSSIAIDLDGTLYISGREGVFAIGGESSECIQGAVDVMVVIDRSASMVGSPLADEKTAAKGFIDRLDLNVDQVGLVSFSNDATLDYPLTQNAEGIKMAIDAIVDGGSTNMSSAIDMAQDELTSSRHNTTAKAVMLFMSDGKPTVDTTTDAFAAAQAAKSANTRIFTIGLGSGVDSYLMSGLASSSSDYYYAATSAQLPGIYEQIARIVTCNFTRNIYLPLVVR